MLLTLLEQTEIARNLAMQHDVSDDGHRAWRKTLAQFRRDANRLLQFCRLLRSSESLDENPSEDWLADHADFIAAQTRLVYQTFVRRLNRRLPVLRTGDLPRMLSVCDTYIQGCDAHWTEESFVGFVNAYQEACPLTIAESWLLPFALRMALVRSLVHRADKVQERHRVETIVDRFVAQRGANGDLPMPILSMATTVESAVDGGILAALVRRMHNGDEDADWIRLWLGQQLGGLWNHMETTVAQEHRRQSAEQMTIGNAISSLRDLSRLDWRKVYRQIGAAEKLLQTDETGIYDQLDDTSKATLRKRIEKLAQRWRIAELAVAGAVVEAAAERARAHADTYPVPRDAFVAYYLMDAAGVKRLRETLKLRAGPRDRPPNVNARRYFGLLTVSFVCALAIMAALVSGLSTLHTLDWLLVVAFCLLPASEWAVAFVHWLMECTITPTPLLRYDFSAGIPDDAMTMVVVPVIWSSPDEVQEMAERLALHYVSTRDAHVHFAILGDFSDASAAHETADLAILDVAQSRIEELNQTYGTAHHAPFHLFHRKRTWNDSERRYMGWERKRGKLVEFVELLRGSRETSYDVIVGDRTVLPDIRYVVTLDTDTRVPLGSVQRMVATMHLPYHRPRVNAQGTRVVEGYGILQPRVGVRYEASRQSWLARLWSGNPGIDPYAFALSDPYQDAFGQGIFTGKGIFDVDVFHRILCPRIPPNRVLSHDLLEGGFLRAGLLSDVEVIDDFPATFASYQHRLHRWIRGDWQLLGWLRGKARNRLGVVQSIDLSVVTRWQIFDNLRRSVLQPVLLLTLFAGLTVLPGHTGRWFWLVALTLGIPLLRHCASARRVLEDPIAVLHVSLQTLVAALLLPVQTCLLVDAIVRTLYRLTISKRRLLEWVSSAQVEREHHQQRASSLRGLLQAYVLIGGFALGMLAFAQPRERLFGLLMCAIWALAPLYARILDRTYVNRRHQLAAEQIAELLDVAHDTWGYYRDFAQEADHFLPPDNVQVDPPRGAARRTSPTNIGMMFSAIVSAKELGIIDQEEALDRLDKTLCTVEKLEKWHGHLLNWYATQSLQPLAPRYVSTVDSGNFVASLMAVRQGLLDWPTERGSGAEQLADRMEALIVGTDFRPLFDHDTGLFTLGYHIQEQRLDTIFYDLLASEARMASFVAIALGQVSVSHWFAMSRAMTRMGRHTTLLSWSGTMFEYLMPALLMRTYRGTLWDVTYRGVLRQQMRYALRRGIPFGISESGYYAFDFDMNYQYQAFGVPGLGFKRGLEQNLVVAPYATVLALAIEPESCLLNLHRLADIGARGRYGFFEALDFTRARLPQGRSQMVIRSYMAHHQGMVLLSLANLLCADVMVERFHRDIRVKAAELLLQERVPQKPNVIPNPAAVMPKLSPQAPATDQTTREFAPPPQDGREVTVLSNGALTTFIDTAGNGFMKLDDLYITRWRDDPLQTRYGTLLFIHDVESGATWSPSASPLGTRAATRVVLSLHEATFQAVQDDVETALSVSVSAEANVELRRLTVRNKTNTRRRLEVTSFIELALAPLAADAAHPAFSKLFIETDYDADIGCLTAHRRERSELEHNPFVAHALSAHGHDLLGPVQFDTNRATFVGRGRRTEQPGGLLERLSGVVGAVAEPALILRGAIEVDPGETRHLCFVTAIAPSKQEAIRLATRFSDVEANLGALQLAWNRSQIELQHLHLKPELAISALGLAARLMVRTTLDAVTAAAIRDNQLAISGLWPLGLSGDLPIIVLYASDSAQMPFVATVVRLYTFLRRRGLRFDLVIVAASVDGYQQPLFEALQRTVERAADHDAIQQSGGVTLLAADKLAAEQATLIAAVARVSLRADGQTLQAQLRRQPSTSNLQQAMEPRALPSPFSQRPWHHSAMHNDLPALTRGLKFWNGIGGFTDDGSEYRIYLDNGRNLPLPWSNLVASPDFGFLVTELGTGYTWWRNSRECKLTPWRNDPIDDIPSEVCYLRDERTGSFWSATPAPIRNSEPYVVTHGFGYTRFEHEHAGIGQVLTLFTPTNDPVKIMLLTLTNQDVEPAELSVTMMVDWVLGVDPQANRCFVVSQWRADLACLVARNTAQEAFRDAHAFLHVHVDGQAGVGSWTADRTEFLGVHGDYAVPAGMTSPVLSGKTGPVADACGAVRVAVRVGAGESTRVVILLGCTTDDQAVERLVRTYQAADAAVRALDDVRAHWHGLLGQVTIETPSESMNLLHNGWLLYQTIACRMWARTGFYQAGGAFGYRDQLQDALATLHTDANLTRRQLLLHAAHQFLDGDVQHWWHEETHKGIRTHFSDDLLWLPYAVSRYVEHTGDVRILSEAVPYLQADALAGDEDERYGDTVVANVQGSVYEHCQRAVGRALRFGIHGLPLMGSGDWNDGMNLVGAKGKGESVWLGWFLTDVLWRMERLAESMGDSATAVAYATHRVQLAAALNQHGWDGQWYRRAFSDEGQWIGSIHAKECRIDAIAQAWSVISGHGEAAKRMQAMHSFQRELVDEGLSIAKLLTPPFDTSAPSPGYIQGYPPGIRENGGQYTHGVIWSVAAWAALADGDRAMALYERLLPVNHARTPGEVGQYQGEPYVMAADVYANGWLAGRAGWTWYTGAAGWTYQVGLEWILGVRRRGSYLQLRPAIPKHWPGYALKYRIGRAIYRITVQRAHNQASTLTVDGLEVWRSVGDGVPTEKSQTPGGQTASPHRDVLPTAAAPSIALVVAPSAGRMGVPASSPCPQFFLVDDGKSHTVHFLFNPGDVGSWPDFAPLD